MKNRDVLNGAGESARGGSVQGNFSATARGSRGDGDGDGNEKEMNTKDEKLPEK